VVKLHIVLVYPLFAYAVLVFTLHATLDYVHVSVHVGFLGDDLCYLGAITHRVDVPAGLDDCRSHGARGVRVLLHKFETRAEHLLGMILPDILGGDGGKADTIEDRARVPRLADAVAVHVAYAHVRHHLRRWHSDSLDVGKRVDAMRAEPVINPHGMRAG